jgi:hypothetical protein
MASSPERMGREGKGGGEEQGGTLLGGTTWGGEGLLGAAWFGPAARLASCALFVREGRKEKTRERKRRERRKKWEKIVNMEVYGKIK